VPTILRPRRKKDESINKEDMHLLSQLFLLLSFGVDRG